MHSRLCRCCGELLEDGLARGNPNLCTKCAETGWPQDTGAGSGNVPLLECLPVASEDDLAELQFALGDVPSDWHHFTNLDQPSVIECLKAEIAAKKAIAELADREAKTLEEKLSAIKKRAPGIQAP